MTTSKIANGAVSATKIQGPLPASLIDRSGLDADTVDGLHAAAFALASHGHDASEISGLGAYQKRSTTFVTVAADGTGDFADLGAALSATASGLIRVLPGTYELSSPGRVAAGVTLEGSGEKETQIVFRGAAGSSALSVASGAELRSLSVSAEGCDAAVNISAQLPAGLPPVRLSNVTVTFAGPPGQWGESSGIFVGLNQTSVDEVGVVLDHVSVGNGAGLGAGNSSRAIYAGGMGTVQLRRGNLSVTGVDFAMGIGGDGVAGIDVAETDIEVEGTTWAVGVNGAHDPAVVRNSRIRAVSPGPTYAGAVAFAGEGSVSNSELYASGGSSAAVWSPGGVVKLAHTLVSGSLSNASFRCIGLYDADLAPVVCPTP